MVAGYERALDRTLAFCVSLARLDIDERVVKVNTGDQRCRENSPPPRVADLLFSNAQMARRVPVLRARPRGIGVRMGA